MRIFLYNILTIVITVVLLFTISLSLDTQFIQAHTVRQLIVYVVMGIVFYLSINIIILINRDKN